MTLTSQQQAWLDEGITLFNEGKHWHAHEAWEELWKSLEGDERRFIQGLIMAAALLVHYDRKNAVGVGKHWANVQERLIGTSPLWEVDVEALVRQLSIYVQDAARGPDAMTRPSIGAQIVRRRV